MISDAIKVTTPQRTIILISAENVEMQEGMLPPLRVHLGRRLPTNLRILGRFKETEPMLVSCAKTEHANCLPKVSIWGPLVGVELWLPKTHMQNLNFHDLRMSTYLEIKSRQMLRPYLSDTHSFLIRYGMSMKRGTLNTDTHRKNTV